MDDGVGVTDGLGGAVLATGDGDALVPGVADGSAALGDRDGEGDGDDDGEGDGDEDGEGDRDEDGEGDEDGDAEAVGAGRALGDAEGEGLGEGLALGLGDGSAAHASPPASALSAIDRAHAHARSSGLPFTRLMVRASTR